MNIKNWFKNLGVKAINQVDDTVVASIMNNTKNVVDDILRAPNANDLIRDLSNSLKSNQTYRKIYTDSVEEASRVKYGKTFDELKISSPNDAKVLAEEIHKNLSKDITDYLSIRQRSANARYGSNKRSYDRLSNNPNASSVDLNQKKTFLELSKANKSSIDEFKRVFGGIPTRTYDEILEIIGTPNAQQIPNPNNTSKPFTKFTIPKNKLKLLAGIGIGGIAVWALYSTFAGGNDFTIVDEDGNQIPTDFAQSGCLLEFLKNGSGIITTASDGSKVIKVSNNNYPNGLLFYSNGRVYDIAGRRKGSYSCKTNASTLAESKKLSLFNILLEATVSNEIDVDTMNNYVNTAVDDLDGYVNTNNLQSLKNILTNLNGKTYKGQNALNAFLNLYKELEGGEDFISTVNSVGVKTLSRGVEASGLKTEILNLAKGSGTSATATSTSSGGNSSVDDVVNLSWDSSSGGGQGGGSTGGGQSSGSRPIPPELVDAQGVMAFQNWLDRKTVRWHKKYGKLYGDKSKGYGIYGPNTSKAWEDYGYMYMKELENANSPSQNDALSTNDITPDVMRKSSADYQAATGSRPGFGSISTAQQRADIERIKRERGL